jgi:hypothetical protein
MNSEDGEEIERLLFDLEVLCILGSSNSLDILQESSKSS